MSVIDSHCHYNLPPFYPDWESHWKTAQARGVFRSTVVGTNIETSKRAVEIANTDEQLFATVAIHPNEYNALSPADLPTTLMAQQSILVQLIKQGAIAIGETGLDFFRISDGLGERAKENQRQALRMHLQLANEYQLPVLLHVRDSSDGAYWEVLELLKTEYAWQRPAVLHCVSGPVEYVQAAVTLGAYIGVAGNVTYPNADHIRKIVKSVPIERVLIETDAPYLPPQEFRGKTCEPWMITETSTFLSDLLTVSADQFVQNANHALGLTPLE